MSGLPIHTTLALVCALTFLGCGTLSRSHYASGAPPLCSRELGRIAVVPETAWRIDQKEPALRTEMATRALQRAFSRADCGADAEIQPFSSWASELEQEQLSRLSAHGFDSAIFLRVEELGPTLHLTLSLPFLWSSTSEAQLRMRAIHIETGRVLLDATIHRETGGPFQLRPASWAEAELEAAVHTLLREEPPRTEARGVEDLRTAVLRADRERSDAMVGADADRLLAALHEDMSYAHSSGTVDTRASLIESLVSRNVVYRSIETQNTTARVYGETAIVTGESSLHVVSGTAHQRPKLVYTAVYRWQSGRWQLSAYHSSSRPRN